MFQKENKYYENVSNNSEHLLESYSKYMELFIDKVYPDVKDKLIYNIKNQKPKDVKTHYIDYPKEGEMLLKEDSLLNIANNMLDDDVILTPTGACYVKAEKKESMSSSNIKEKKAERSKVKKEMLTLYAKNDNVNAQNLYFKQLAIKRNINSFSGLTNRTIYAKSIPNYNAITGSARSNVMSGYALLESLLGANHYFYTYDDAINFILSLLIIYPGDDKILEIVNKYILKIPEDNDFKYYIYRGVRIYHTSNKTNKSLDKLIDSLSSLEKTFIFYAQCLNNLFFYNSKIFKCYFNELSDFEKIDNNDIDISQSLFDLEDNDLLMAVITASCKVTAGITIDDLEKEIKDKKKIILNRYYYIYNELKRIEPLMDTFMLIPFNIESLFEHTNMIRNVTVLSDTDSNIFTTINFVYWFTNDIKFSNKAMFIHGMMVYLSVKMLEHILALSVKRTNADTKNIKIISMKNEFFYKVLIRTVLSKHYIASLYIQEGVVYENDKIDIKGKNLKASDLALDITDSIEKFGINIAEEIANTQNLNIENILKKIITLEYTIYRSLKNGDLNYAFSIPIKDKSEYEKPLQSQYFNYLLWQEVFSEKYSNIEIPSKVKVIKLISKISYKSTKIIDYMKNEDEQIYNKLINFLKQYSKKKIDILILPLDIKIPKILLPIIAYREIISRNLFGMYLLLRSLGITYIDINNKKLLGEIYSDYKYD